MYGTLHHHYIIVFVLLTDGEYMPFLRPSLNEDSYINASFIDVSLPLSLIKLAPLTITILQGYKYHKAYIATQGPLLNTTEDMWRMVWEVKSKVMVLLCSFTEDGHEAAVPDLTRRFHLTKTTGGGRTGIVIINGA